MSPKKNKKRKRKDIEKGEESNDAVIIGRDGDNYNEMVAVFAHNRLKRIETAVFSEHDVRSRRKETKKCYTLTTKVCSDLFI